LEGRNVTPFERLEHRVDAGDAIGEGVEPLRHLPDRARMGVRQA
jgi:hypothetical protein